MVPAGKRPGASTATAREVRSRRGPRGAGADGDDHTLLLQLGRLTLQNARDIRAHAAALQHVALISSEHSIAKAMNAKGQQYAAERASGSEATLLGAPHHHVWAAMILEM
eukprot:14458693-Heterocapsa_arctica.AAC.1